LVLEANAAGAGDYTVADVAIATSSSLPGNWGDWTLVVAYEDPAGTRHHGVIVSDQVPAGMTYVPNLLVVEGGAVTDASGDDLGEFTSGPDTVVGRVGTGATATAGGTLAGGESGELRFDADLTGPLPASGSD